jgi:polyisoprenoid-binding protein YceI
MKIPSSTPMNGPIWTRLKGLKGIGMVESRRSLLLPIAIRGQSTARRNDMRKKSILTALVLVLGIGTVAAQGTYAVDTVHSNVVFKVRHLVSKVSGEFTEFDGAIVADFENLDASSVEFEIQTNSIDTKNKNRDGHLRSADFFDTEQFPEITFKSNKITKVDGNTYSVSGILNMRGVGKEITMMVEFLGEMTAMGGIRAGYELTTTLNRKDYGVAWNRELEAGVFVLGDEVEVTINLEVIKQEAALP